MTEYQVIFQMRASTVKFESRLNADHVNTLLKQYRKNRKPVFTIVADSGMSMAINLADCVGITWTEIK